MLRRSSLLTLSFFASSTLLANTPVRVVASTPEVAMVVAGIGGPLVQVVTLLSGHENPHLVTPRPAFTGALASADVVCLIGLDLETSYLKEILESLAKPSLRAAGRGHCELGQMVRVLDKPFVTPEPGNADLHPYGNPHYWLSPLALGQGAAAAAAALIRIDPEHKAAYDRGLTSLRAELAAISQRVSGELAPVRERQKAAGHPLLMEYHREYLYYLSEYGLDSRGSLEDMPGSMPSARRLHDVALGAKHAGVRLVLAANYDPEDRLQKFQAESGVAVVQVPTMMLAGGGLKDYEALQERLAAVILATTKP